MKCITYVYEVFTLYTGLYRCMYMYINVACLGMRYIQFPNSPGLFPGLLPPKSVFFPTCPPSCSSNIGATTTTGSAILHSTLCRLCQVAVWSTDISVKAVCGQRDGEEEVTQDEQYVGNMLNLMLAISLITQQSKAMVISVQLESQVYGLCLISSVATTVVLYIDHGTINNPGSRAFPFICIMIVNKCAGSTCLSQHNYLPTEYM